MRIPLLIILAASFAAATSPGGENADGGAKKKAEPAEPKIVRTEGQATIAGKSIPYTAETGTLLLETDDGKPRASIFHVSYLRNDVEDLVSRPVIFAFNGGPGSSAVWLHLGALGPKHVVLPENGTAPPRPPMLVTDNPESILDVADIVLVDPVSTGYSRVAGSAKPAEFHGFKGDIESVGDFIRRWITEHKRWGSPKFLLGESYGGIRAAGLADHLQSRYGMALNGVVLVSSLIDFRTVDSSPGNDLSYIAYFPAFAAVARYHGRTKSKGTPDQLAAEAEKFAFGPYAAALLAGNQLPDPQRRKIAVRYAELTGLPENLVLGSDLRVSPSRFRAELLRDQARTLGRFDARVTRPTSEPASARPDGDPSFDYAYGAFSTAMLDYLRSSLDWTAEKPYEILTGKVNPWKGDGHENLSRDLADAMTANPHLHLLVMCGSTDLATPPAGIQYSLRHLKIPRELQANIRIARYQAGHMFYLNPPDLAKMRRDLVDFLKTAN